MKHVQAIILAGGRGKRMGVHEMQNKVMIPLNGKPMLAYPVERLARMGIEHPIVVVGHAKESIFSYFGDSLIYAEQKQQLGTADAVGYLLGIDVLIDAYFLAPGNNDRRTAFENIKIAQYMQS